MISGQAHQRAKRGQRRVRTGATVWLVTACALSACSAPSGGQEAAPTPTAPSTAQAPPSSAEMTRPAAAKSVTGSANESAARLGSLPPLEAKPAQPNDYVPASTKSPSRNAVAPKRPANLQSLTLGAAYDFVEYWVDAYNYSLDVNGASLVELNGAYGCDDCTQVSDELLRVQQSGAWVVGGRWHVEAVDAKPRFEKDGLVHVRVSLSKEAGSVHGWNGPEKGDFPLWGKAKTEALIFKLGYERDHGWFLYEIVGDKGKNPPKKEQETAPPTGDQED